MRTKPYKYPAVSLVEVLIVLALVATTMVAASQVTVSALVKIKENEVDDYVNGLMVRVLEAAKSPQTLTIDNSVSGQTPFQGSYILNIPASQNGTNGEKALPGFKQQQVNTDPIKAATCSDTSPNYVKLPELGVFVPPAVCLQATVVPLTGIGSIPIYQITVRAAYNVSSGPVERELVGYRRADVLAATPPTPAPPPAPQCGTTFGSFTINQAGITNGQNFDYGDRSLCTDTPATTGIQISGGLDDIMVITAPGTKLTACSGKGTNFCWTLPDSSILIEQNVGSPHPDDNVTSIFCYKTKCTPVCSNSHDCGVSDFTAMGVPTVKINTITPYSTFQAAGFIASNKASFHISYAALGNGSVSLTFAQK